MQRQIQSQEVGIGKSDEIVVVVMLSLFPHALSEAYKNDAVVQKWVRRMLALPLVPLQLFLRGTNGLAYLAVVDVWIYLVLIHTSRAMLREFERKSSQHINRFIIVYNKRSTTSKYKTKNYAR